MKQTLLRRELMVMQYCSNASHTMDWWLDSSQGIFVFQPSSKSMARWPFREPPGRCGCIIGGLASASLKPALYDTNITKMHLPVTRHRALPVPDGISMTLGYGSFRVHEWHGGIAPSHPCYRLHTGPFRDCGSTPLPWRNNRVHLRPDKHPRQ